MRRSSSIRVAAALALAAGALVAFGCGVEEDVDLEAGKQLFVANCGACHVLEDAGTQGQIGPNLDDAFRGSRQSGIPESQFQGVVRKWIEISEPPMPRDLVTGQDADDVAAYVAEVAGTSESSAVRAAPPETPQAFDPTTPAGGPAGTEGGGAAEEPPAE